MPKVLETQKTKSCRVLTDFAQSEGKENQCNSGLLFDIQLKIVLFPYRPSNTSHISWEM